MAIDNPDLFDRPIASKTGVLASATQITVDDNTPVETLLANLQTLVSQIGGASFSWEYNSETDGTPPNEGFEFNNADPASADAIYFDKDSREGRLDQFLEQFALGGFLFFQDRTSTGNTYLFVTSSTFSDSGNSDRYEVSVTFQQGKGTFTGANGDVFDVIFLPITGTGGTGMLPNMFLNEISEQDTPTYTRKIDTEAVVRIWLRAAQVTPGTVNDPGVGLLISEANGDLPEGGDTYRDDANHPNNYIYLTLDSVFDTATDLNTVWMRITRDQGQPDERVIHTVNVGMHFSERTDLTAVVAGVAYESATGFDGNGPFVHYLNGDTIELYFQDTNQFFTISEENAPNVDLTRAVKNLPESATDSDVQAKLNRVPGISDIDQSKLDVFVEQTSASTPGPLTGADNMYYKRGSFSNDVNDYFVTTFDDGLPPNFGDGTTTWLVAAPHTTEITSFANDVATGTATKILTDVKITGATAKAYDVYTVVLNSSGASTVAFGALGATITVTEIDPTSIFKIGTNNFNDALAADFARLHGGQLSDALQDFQNKLTVAHAAGANWTVPANPTRVASTITSEWAAFVDENRTGATPFTGNRFTNRSNPTLALNNPVWSVAGDDIRFPGKNTFHVGRVDVSGNPPLTLTSNKLYLLEFYIEDLQFNENLPLLKLGTRSLLRVDRSGVLVRVGNSDGNPVEASFQERLTPPNSQTTIQYLEGIGVNSVEWFIPDTLTFPVDITFRMKVVDNGVTATTVTELVYAITDRDTDQLQTQQVVATNLPVSGTRDETFTLEYSSSTNVLTIGTTGLSQNGPNLVTRIGMEATHDDTRDIETSVTTRDVNVDSTVSVIRREVSILCMIEPTNPIETSADKFLTAKIILNGNQENNISLNLRQSDYTPNDLQFGPNSGDEIALTNMQVWSWDNGGVPFNTPTHAELYRLWQNRERYLGLLLSPEQDFSTYTLDGNIILTDSGGTTFDLITLLNLVNRTWVDSPGQTGGPDYVFDLPSNTTLSDFVLVSVEFNTGQTDGSASDNDHRRYSATISTRDIINADGTSVNIGGFGRGAENFVINILQADGSATQLALEMINLNDAGGATLPTGSEISEVSFY